MVEAMTTDGPADREAGELCEDVVAGCIGPVERPHVYRISVAAEVSR